MDLERAAKVIEALPYMSKKIVDDTLYEKVLSFLVMVLTHEANAIEAFQQWHVFQHLTTACQVKDQDYRVITLCVRLLGQMVYAGGSGVFAKLVESHGELLELVTTGLRSSEPALRCSCLEACRRFTSCDGGQDWLANNERATVFIALALLDESHFVVTEACRLFSEVLESPALVARLDPSDAMKPVLASQCNLSQTMSALELCWSVANLKKPSTLAYLHQTQLFASLVPLIFSDHRMVRSRVLEILSVLFTWDPRPIRTLCLQGPDHLEGAYRTMVALAQQIISTQPMERVMTGVALLGTAVKLLKRQELDLNIDTLLLVPLLNTCLGREPKVTHVAGLLQSVQMKNNLLQAVLNVLTTYCAVQRLENVQAILAVFENKEAYTDPRVLKSGLALLQTLFVHDTDRILQLLTEMMEGGDFDAKRTSLLLETFDVFLDHLTLTTPAVDRWVDALGYKFLDPEWDVRDAAIQFVGELFKQPVNKAKVSFALKYDLPLSVLNRIQDTEPYVRASAVDVLQNMMQSKEGWDYIQQHQQSRHFLASQLPSLLCDTEAFVKRAALDALCCLIEHRSCQGICMESEDREASLNPKLIRTLADDPDPDVRVKACRLLESLWHLYQHEKQQNKKGVPEKHVFFYCVPVAELLVQSANDTHRLVRSEAVRVIESMQVGQKDGGKKRRLEDEYEARLMNQLRAVNISQQKQTLDPEHIYKEAFEISVEMMTSQHGGESVLDCE